MGGPFLYHFCNIYPTDDTLPGSILREYEKTKKMSNFSISKILR